MTDRGPRGASGGIGHQPRAPALVWLVGKGFHCEVQYMHKKAQTHTCSVSRSSEGNAFINPIWWLYFCHHVETLEPSWDVRSSHFTHKAGDAVRGLGYVPVDQPVQRGGRQAGGLCRSRAGAARNEGPGRQGPRGRLAGGRRAGGAFSFPLTLLPLFLKLDGKSPLDT